MTSHHAILYVNTSSSITTPPSNQPLSFLVIRRLPRSTPFPYPPLYRSKKNGTNVGTNSNTYTTPATVIGDNGAVYTVVVSNVTTTTVTSSNAVLTVNAASVPPSITTQPTDQSATLGSTATFTVVAWVTARFAFT